MRYFFNNNKKIKKKKMAKTGKSIIDEAFMEAESIDKAFKANAKEILAQTMSSEIEEMVKESLEGSIGLNEEEDEDVDLDLSLDSDEAGLDTGEEEDMDLDLGDDEDMDSDFEVKDLTGEKNIDMVVNVFKKMSPEDEIEVVQDEDGVGIKDKATGAEYKIELGGSTTDLEDDEDMDLELGNDEDMEDEMGDYMEEGTIYEIVLDEEMEDEMEDEMEEGKIPRTLGKASKLPNRKSADISDNRSRMGESTKPSNVRLINENKVLKNKISSIVSENETLREDYNKMVDALKEFRQKLNEVAVFNSNLTYTVRLFTEHSTTKDEKVDIIKRFDEAKSLKESKNIYKNLVKEISKTKAPIKESIDEKLNETKSSGSATQITESKVYVDPQMEKMKKLWEYSYKN